MIKWKLKGCPRCSGDLYLEQNAEHEWVESCLQCGYVKNLKLIKQPVLSYAPASELK